MPDSIVRLPVHMSSTKPKAARIRPTTTFELLTKALFMVIE